MSIDVNDIKQRVAKTPLKPGGTNFRTHIIKSKGSKLAYKPTLSSIFFCQAFFVPGISMLILSIFLFFIKNEIESGFIALILGSVFSLVGGLMSYFCFKPRVFDKQLGIFYKVYKFQLKGTYFKNSKKCISLDSIVAIQIIGERISSENSTYGSFELNLVLNDVTRLNVIDHGNLKSIIYDAYQISEFLNIPIWNAETSNDPEQTEFKA